MRTFSLSTSWNSPLHSSGKKIVNEIKELGFQYIELGFSLSIDTVEEILSMKDKGLIKISSLHNICPVSKGIEIDEASPDYYSLASGNEEERRLAVNAAKNTIAYAHRSGAEAIVLHTGRIPTEDRMWELANAFDDKGEYERIKREMIEERKDRVDGYLDNVVRSLKELVPIANSCNVKIAIETRYSYRDIPIADEFEHIFANIKDVWYWHDTGHAEAFDRLGLANHKGLLDRFRGRLIGIHLHDIIGFLNDHRAPLCGTFDFEKVVPYMRDDTIKVIEAHQPATRNQVKRGLAYLKKIFGE